MEFILEIICFKRIKDGTFAINLDEYADVGAHCIVLYVSNNGVIYFNSFGVENIPTEIKKFIGNKSMQTSIFRVQANNSIMCGYFCIELINFMLAGKALIDYTTLFQK